MRCYACWIEVSATWLATEMTATGQTRSPDDVLHELGTNAVKHGALSIPTGVIKIRWDLETGGPHEGRLRIIWEEVGGPRVEQPQRHGFGELVITKLVPVSLRGTALLEFEPGRVKWVLLASSSSVVA
jgi:two-component sensor histidine kinase